MILMHIGYYIGLSYISDTYDYTFHDIDDELHFNTYYCDLNDEEYTYIYVGY